jgi:hypothetical protein
MTREEELRKQGPFFSLSLDGRGEDEGEYFKK